MFGTCFGHVRDMFWTCSEHVSDMCLACFGQALANLLDKLGDVGIEDSVSVAFAKRMGVPQPAVVEEPAPPAFASQAGSVHGSTRLADKVRTVDGASVVSCITRGVLELPVSKPADEAVAMIE